mmetsp:Transcript_11836/g.34203  ORF Transcript_11836/g.34203 Transcript_11836/m.34203 type:complete len:217 (-) Transcript_11836:14-664(-)
MMTETHRSLSDATVNLRPIRGLLDEAVPGGEDAAGAGCGGEGMAGSDAGGGGGGGRGGGSAGEEDRGGADSRTFAPSKGAGRPAPGASSGLWRLPRGDGRWCCSRTSIPMSSTSSSSSLESESSPLDESSSSIIASRSPSCCAKNSALGLRPWPSGKSELRLLDNRGGDWGVAGSWVRRRGGGKEARKSAMDRSKLMHQFKKYRLSAWRCESPEIS